MQEEWKDIKFTDTDGREYDYTGYYQVSNMGRVRSLNYKNTGEIRTLKLTKDKENYSTITFRKDKKIKTFKVHRLVAFMFIPNPENKPEVDHIIPIKNGGTNEVTNLRWVTGKENRNNELTVKNMKNRKNRNYNVNSNNSGVICLETLQFFETHKEAAEWCNLKDRPGIGKCCLGKQQSCGKHPVTGEKLHWMYYDEYLKLNENSDTNSEVA